MKEESYSTGSMIGEKQRENGGKKHILHCQCIFILKNSTGALFFSRRS